MLTENPGSLLTTIRSRCEALSLVPVSPAEAEYELARRFPQLPREARHAAARRCGGLLGQAVAELEGQEDPGRRLLELLAGKSRLDTAVWCVSLEKWTRDQVEKLLERSLALLRDALALQRGASIMTASPQELPAVQAAAALSAKRLLSMAGLVEKLRKDAAFNANVGQLCGGLMAGINAG